MFKGGFKRMNQVFHEDYCKSCFAYVVNLFGSSVSVIDVDTLKVIATIPVHEFPWDVAITPNGKRAYVTTGSLTFNITDFIEVIDTKYNNVINSIPVGNEILRADPLDISITPNGKFAYISNFASNNVTVIDTRTNTVADTVISASFVRPQGVAITPNGRYVYIMNAVGDTVSVIDIKTNTVVDTIAVGHTPLDADITPDGKYVYVTNYESNSVSVICTRYNTVIDIIAVGEGPDGIVISPDGERVYVANDFGSTEEVGTVSVIDRSRNKVIDTIPVGHFPVEVALTPDGKLLFVTNLNDNTVSVIDTCKNIIIRTIFVGEGPVSVAITPVFGEDKHE